MFKLLVASSFLLAATPAWAVLPSYGTPEILARANGFDNYNLPRLTYLNSTSSVINNQGEVAFKLMAVDGQVNQGLWMKRASDAAGKVVYTAPEDKIITDPNLNDLGQMAFSIYDEGSSDGLFVYDSKAEVVSNPLKGSETDLIYFSYSQILNDGHIVFRGTNKDNERSFLDFSADLKSIAAEGLENIGAKPSYLFKPSINENHQWAFKARLGEKDQWGNERPDQIILLSPSGAQVIAQTQNADSTSPYLGFGNTVSLSENGLVAFVGYTAGNVKNLIVAKNGSLHTLVTEGKDVSELELFSPVINNSGIVAFRAKDLNGKRAIFIADESGIKRVLTEGDDIKTDLGRGRILSRTDFPGFGGDIGFNNKNEISFYVILESANDGADWGSAVYKISPQQ